MSEFLYKYRDYIALGFCVFLSMLLLNTNDNPQMHKLRLKSAVIGSIIARPFAFIPKTVRLYGENRELNHSLFILNRENFRLYELEAENERLRKMLNFIETTSYAYIPAKVISRSSGEVLNSVTIDKGERDSIRNAYPVMSSEGLAGRIVAVNENNSICQLMLDNQFGAAVKIQRNRIDGILHWQWGNDCRLDGIPTTVDVRSGDTLVTSGLGGVYPKGLRAGIVNDVKRVRGNLFQDITVIPFCDFQRLEEVFILIPVE